MPALPVVIVTPKWPEPPVPVLPVIVPTPLLPVPPVGSALFLNFSYKLMNLLVQQALADLAAVAPIALVAVVLALAAIVLAREAPLKVRQTKYYKIE
jgi:hypothetical protein